MKKLIFVPYFGNKPVGDLPSWTNRFLACTNKLKPAGWDFMILTDRHDFDERARKILQVEPGWQDLRKPTDFFPMLGLMYQDCLWGYEFWGYSGLDEVYGRLDRFVTDEILRSCDVWAADRDMLCGPLSLYRNEPDINELFKKDPEWKTVLSSTHYYGYDEGGFDKLVKESGLRVKYDLCHSWDKMPVHNPRPQLLLEPDGTLIDGSVGKEIAFFHFNRMQEWPL